MARDFYWAGLSVAWADPDGTNGAWIDANGDPFTEAPFYPGDTGSTVDDNVSFLWSDGKYYPTDGPAESLTIRNFTWTGDPASPTFGYGQNSETSNLIVTGQLTIGTSGSTDFVRFSGACTGTGAVLQGSSLGVSSFGANAKVLDSASTIEDGGNGAHFGDKCLLATTGVVVGLFDGDVGISAPTDLTYCTIAGSILLLNSSAVVSPETTSLPTNSPWQIAVNRYMRVGDASAAEGRYIRSGTDGWDWQIYTCATNGKTLKLWANTLSVTGTLSPDVTGTYSLAGYDPDWNDWCWENETYRIRVATSSESDPAIVIVAKADNETVLFRQDLTSPRSSPVGTFTPVGESTGSPMVAPSSGTDLWGWVISADGSRTEPYWYADFGSLQLWGASDDWFNLISPFNPVGTGDSVQVYTSVAPAIVRLATVEEAAAFGITVNYQMPPANKVEAGTVFDGATKTGAYPTTETSKAAQLAEDTAVVEADKDKILPTATNIAAQFGVEGTFDEAARNTDPLVGNVRSGTTYKIANASKTGTLDITADNPPQGIIGRP